ncbi:hypothetical protein A2866_05590 [Candidatus Roizmanbacteria bacterium RIFCSPHIGHO2_01_FULL_39_8]|uniref:DUF6677 domain-containing protein n=1 Tax=Candidatus Roizmanbacteria bacterium RIFCSPHIGHO2_01_FULL_39_8 TaxID=1802033 RepID=A0A1F7GHI9_9BACT|nr:MAG: hypothetical protein A2866_05590 [Candidatus Roizmanbacteria bacterium RIFCSPHIGHO2_01_FULL_39_8]
MKNKKVAALLALLFPGLGHLYIGKYIDALVFIAGTGILWYAFFLKGAYLISTRSPNYYLVLGALIFVYLFSIFDVYRKTK